MRVQTVEMKLSNELTKGTLKANKHHSPERLGRPTGYITHLIASYQFIIVDE